MLDLFSERNITLENYLFLMPKQSLELVNLLGNSFSDHDYLLEINSRKKGELITIKIFRQATIYFQRIFFVKNKICYRK